MLEARLAWGVVGVALLVSCAGGVPGPVVDPGQKPPDGGTVPPDGGTKPPPKVPACSYHNVSKAIAGPNVTCRIQNRSGTDVAVRIVDRGGESSENLACDKAEGSHVVTVGIRGGEFIYTVPAGKIACVQQGDRTLVVACVDGDVPCQL